MCILTTELSFKAETGNEAVLLVAVLLCALACRVHTVPSGV